ncbi:hypothetical protein PSm6_46340 [Pseudomonas solani]|uniref:Uncharacterized protein n=1 Tax=Pseudomonas solani TaxID=2731552 RepID=A0ABM7LF18_9PSED|nr:hypothetical protein PSm6_46340 [Pseudomonas solani]
MGQGREYSGGLVAAVLRLGAVGIDGIDQHGLLASGSSGGEQQAKQESERTDGQGSKWAHGSNLI